MEKTLVILAAGMGSRYGGLKQMEGFGPQGETLLEYNLYDGLKRGFSKAVFVIRRSMEIDFRQRVIQRLEKDLETEVVFQDLELSPEDQKLVGSDIPRRTKPWGTGHALLAALPVFNEPFVVLNADDYYGAGAFTEAAGFLEDTRASSVLAGLIAYRLEQTLSSHGSVSRGVLEKDAQGFLKRIQERHQIERKTEGIQYLEQETQRKYNLHGKTLVSLNLLACRPGFTDFVYEAWEHFLREKGSDPTTEFGIPDILDHLLQRGSSVAVVPTQESWLGVTHADDAPRVRKGLMDKIEAGHYPKQLWNS